MFAATGAPTKPGLPRPPATSSSRWTAITVILPTRFPIFSKLVLHLDADFLNTSRFPVRDPEAMSFLNKMGNLILSLAMSILYFRWVRDSQSGMWVFRRSILAGMKLTSDGMAFSEEIKIEALKRQPHPLRRDLHSIHARGWAK